MKDCIFCKIVNGQIASYKLYEDDKVIAILDNNPNVDGHTLIICKEHYQDIKEIDDEVLKHIKDVGVILNDKFMKKLNATGSAFMVNYGDRQMIKHFHMHLLPDYMKNKAHKSLDEIYELLKD